MLRITLLCTAFLLQIYVTTSATLSRTKHNVACFTLHKDSPKTTQLVLKCPKFKIIELLTAIYSKPATPGDIGCESNTQKGESTDASNVCNKQLDFHVYNHLNKKCNRKNNCTLKFESKNLSQYCTDYSSNKPCGNSSSITNTSSFARKLEVLYTCTKNVNRGIQNEVKAEDKTWWIAGVVIGLLLTVLITVAILACVLCRYLRNNKKAKGNDKVDSSTSRLPQQINQSRVLPNPSAKVNERNVSSLKKTQLLPKSKYTTQSVLSDNLYQEIPGDTNDTVMVENCLYSEDPPSDVQQGFSKINSSNGKGNIISTNSDTIGMNDQGNLQNGDMLIDTNLPNRLLSVQTNLSQGDNKSCVTAPVMESSQYHLEQPLNNDHQTKINDTVPKENYVYTYGHFNLEGRERQPYKLTKE